MGTLFWLGKEKWEIYAEVTRKIMCEIGGLTPSDKTFRNNKYYENALCKGVYVDENSNLITSWYQFKIINKFK